MENGIAKLQELVDQYDNIVFFGGAGVSTGKRGFRISEARTGCIIRPMIIRRRRS